MPRHLRAWQQNWPEPPPLPRQDGLARTVVIPCYIHARFLPHAVQSRIEQTLPTFDTALVDDCFHSRDAPLLPSLAERRGEHGDVTVLSNETDQGQAASLNEAIAAAQTRVAVLDLPLVWRSDSPVDAGRHS